MQPGAPVERDIVLIGGGHAHVEVMKRFGMRPEPGVRLTLVAKDSLTPYSGMVPGYLRGVYSHDDCHIDLGRLARWSGTVLIRAAASGLNPTAQEVQFADRPPLAYDLLSLDIGSAPPTAAIPGAATHALPIKPLDGFFKRLAELDATLTSGGRLAVVGAGAGGVETALGLKRRFERKGLSISVTLVGDEPEILPGHAPAVANRMRQALADANVGLELGRTVVAIDAAGLDLADGGRIDADLTILVNGAAAADWPKAAGLAVDEAGFIKTNRFLQSPSHPEIFATGDCAAFQPVKLPKSGVYAVRQGPPLARNLRRAALGEPLEPWRPQPVTLSLMSTGDGGAIVSYGRISADGRWAWRWKDRIDRRWMEKYQKLEPMRLEPPSDAELAAPPIMRCGGCGAKVSSPVLRRALDRVGLSDAAGDDAALIRTQPGAQLVQTVDQFKSFIDDPYLFGEIATLHALSDLYAMGAEPASALATAILPHAGDAATERDLTQLLAGVQKALAEAGAELLGGHTGEGAELSLGLSLNGYVQPGAALAKGAAAAGDHLILTKPLGVGALMAADMRFAARTEHVESAIACMRQSAATGARILRANGARALTDVTGFGLAGHLIEMADGAELAVDLEIGRLPALPGAIDTIAAGVESTMAPANAAFAARIAFAGDSADPRRRLLFDPQTSGGLLAALPADEVGRTIAELRRAGYDAADIGVFDAARERSATIRESVS